MSEEAIEPTKSPYVEPELCLVLYSGGANWEMASMQYPLKSNAKEKVNDHPYYLNKVRYDLIKDTSDCVWLGHWNDGLKEDER